MEKRRKVLYKKEYKIEQNHEKSQNNANEIREWKKKMKKEKLEKKVKKGKSERERRRLSPGGKDNIKGAKLTFSLQVITKEARKELNSTTFEGQRRGEVGKHYEEEEEEENEEKEEEEDKMRERKTAEMKTRRSKG